MLVFINGFEKNINSNRVLELLNELNISQQNVVFELNGDIIPKDRFAETTINDDDKIEIVRFVGGG
ncbi:sulfur carrier protein ThiS [bacterium]|nr:sulfur carrier protein ThiS [bacterium]